MTNVGLVGFNQELVGALHVTNANLVTTLQHGIIIEALDKGLVDLTQRYPNADTRGLSPRDFRMLKAEFEHYSSRRRLVLNQEERHVLFMHILSGALQFVASVDALLFSNLPHQGVDAVIAELARIKGKPCQFFSPSIFDQYAYLSSAREGFYSKLHTAPEPAVVAIDTSSKQKVSYMGPTPRRKLKSILDSKLATFREFGRYGRDYPLRLLMVDTVSRYFHHNYRRIEWDSDPEIGGSDVLKIYMPLHLQPELTTSFMGLNYFDQCHAVVQLATLLSRTGRRFQIFVKENPKQDLRMRQFLPNLQDIEGIVFVGRSFPSDNLIEACDMTATITGTAGWEAAKSGKPVIIFGTTWYETAPGVVKFDEITDEDIVGSKRSADPSEVAKWFDDHRRVLHNCQFDKGVSVYAETLDSSIASIEHAVFKAIESVKWRYA